jgi:hypothetical protein
MALILRRSGDLDGVAPTMPRLDRAHGAAQRLHDAFDEVREDWWQLGRALGAEPTGWLSHTAACASMAVDFGVMLAWERVVRDAARASGDTLLICDDPWLFRHLATLEGVNAGKPPPMARQVVTLALRGALARARLALRLALASLRLRRAERRGEAALLVYGHPASEASGRDAYFGTLLNQLSGLSRVLHTDCPAGRARELAVSLHAYGTVWAALGGLFCRWRPSRAARQGARGWLVRRAAAIEGSGAGAAATRWQAICQESWLDEAKPRVVTWPWENHPWERPLVRAARRRGIASIGYQHSVVGRQMYNMTPRANADGDAAIPDAILCNGTAYRAQLARLGVPEERLHVAGSFRIAPPAPGRYDPAAPVFVALAADARIARQMMTALHAAAPEGRHFLIKDHPMYPFAFEEGETMRRTTTVLAEQECVSAVVYSTGTVGIEAMLAGLPTIRFLPAGLVAVDIMPDGLSPIVADAEGLGRALASLTRPPPFPRDEVAAPVDLAVWRRYLEAA